MQELIKFIVDTPLGVSMNEKYANSLQINGFVLQKPRFIKHEETGHESCSFIVHQLNRDMYGIKDKTYSMISYLPSIIEKVKQIDSVCFVNCLARLEWNSKRLSYTPVIHTIEITSIFDKELLPPYERK